MKTAAIALVAGICLLPTVGTPVAAVPLLLVLCGLPWLVLIARDGPWLPLSWLDGLVAVVAFLSLLLVVAHGPTTSTISDYVRWAAAASVIYPLRTLDRADFAVVARAFALCAAAGGFLGMLEVATGSPLGLRDAGLMWIGEAPVSTVTTGDAVVGRVTGPWDDPNAAGFVLAVGVILAVVFLRGWVRIGATGLLGVALLFTLSRASIGSIAAAVVLAAVVGRVRWVAVVGGLGALWALGIPVIRDRIAGSFGVGDVGFAARTEALMSWRTDAAGHWWLGIGVGAPEFSDPALAYTTNFVANTPLYLVLQRGLVVAIVYAAWLVAIGIAAWALLHRPEVERVLLGAGTLGLVLVGLQLDVPVVTLPPVTAAFSVLVAAVAKERHD